MYVRFLELLMLLRCLQYGLSCSGLPAWPQIILLNDSLIALSFNWQCLLWCCGIAFPTQFVITVFYMHAHAKHLLYWRDVPHFFMAWVTKVIVYCLILCLCIIWWLVIDACFYVCWNAWAVVSTQQDNLSMSWVAQTNSDVYCFFMLGMVSFTSVSFLSPSLFHFLKPRCFHVFPWWWCIFLISH